MGIASNPKHLQSFFNLLKSEKKFNLVQILSIKKTYKKSSDILRCLSKNLINIMKSLIRSENA